jgi:succinate-semialdehyde dehydrogenase/glutarate-semialdehyde dehydrogenase
MTMCNALFIDGNWRPAADGRTLAIIDPATGAEVDTVPQACRADLDQALQAADRAWREWREVDAWTRSAQLRQVAEVIRRRVATIAAILTEEQGKTLREAHGEILAAADQFDWYADEARRIYGRTIDGHSRENRLFVVRQSIGPVAAFTPWNFPALLPARKLAAALAAGCSIILKPAEEAPRTALCLVQACHDAGIPAGVVNAVTGDPAAISRYLITSPVIRKVSLTGSVPVGREVLQLCAEGIKPVSLELGGHSPVLVFADADVEAAASAAARAKFRNNGQVCICASRFYVHESVAARFIERFVAVTRSLKLGDGRDPDVDLGPLANARRRTAVQALVRDALERGARLECGGKEPEGCGPGFFFEPTVLSGVTPQMRVMTEEPFGPIAPITTFATFDEALDLANASDYGLAGYIFTRDTRTAFLAAEGLEVGMVGINTLALASAEIPFGGIKQSGFGREGGSEGIEAYTVIKHINLKL